MGKEAANPVLWRRGIATQPCACPKMLKASGHGGHPTHECQILNEPILSGTLRLGAGPTQKPQSATTEAECHRRAWSSHRANFASSLKARPLHIPSSLIPRGTKPKQYLFTEDWGEECKERGSLSPTPPSPRMALHLWRRGTLSQPRARAAHLPERGDTTATSHLRSSSQPPSYS